MARFLRTFLLLLQIWKENQNAFRSIVKALLFDRSLVEDVLQETFVRVLQNQPEFISEEQAFNYLRRSVVNTAIDTYRKIRRRNRWTQSKRTWDNLAELLTPARSQNPLSQLIETEEIHRNSQLESEIREALKKLPREQQKAVETFFHRKKGTRIKELCREQGVPYSTVRSRMLAAVDTIRDILREGELRESEEVIKNDE